MPPPKSDRSLLFIKTNRIYDISKVFHRCTQKMTPLNLIDLLAVFIFSLNFDWWSQTAFTPQALILPISQQVIFKLICMKKSQQLLDRFSHFCLDWIWEFPSSPPIHFIDSSSSVLGNESKINCYQAKSHGDQYESIQHKLSNIWIWKLM